jgi:hypothetical protein
MKAESIRGEAAPMFTQTHRLIGGTIGTIVQQEFPDRLEEKAFQFGCMIPDYARNKMA